MVTALQYEIGEKPKFKDKRMPVNEEPKHKYELLDKIDLYWREHHILVEYITREDGKEVLEFYCWHERDELAIGQDLEYILARNEP